MSTTSFISGKFKFELNLGPGTQPVARDADAPLHILLVGNFRGIGPQPQSAWKPVAVDCDNFDEVMRNLKPQCRVTISEKATDLSFSTIDYFHPDRILPRLSAFLETDLQPAGNESDTGTIRRLLGGPVPSRAPAKAPAGKVDISTMIKAAIGSNAIAAPTAADQATQAASTLAKTDILRAVLHNPGFQALEANWRGLDLLMRNFGGEENIQCSILDCDLETFIGDVSLQDDLKASQFFKLLHARGPQERFALVLGLYAFEPTFAHLGVLARIAKICDAQRATFIAASSPSFIGCDSFAFEADCKALEPRLQAAWSQVRALAEAERVGLALPRFLLRQPYGANGEPIDAFSFEELPADLPHESFLWGNPAVLCGHVLADAFIAEGWKAATNGFGEVGDLPVYRFKANGESKVKPCAETWMPESVSERILAHGLIPILSIKGRDAVRAGGLRSISSRGAALPLG